MQFLGADFIFDGQTFLPPDHVLVADNDGRILDIAVDIPTDRVRHFQGMLMPGMVNAHCHLELSHMKGCIPTHTGLVDFLLQVIKQRNEFTHEQILTGIIQAEEEMLANGIVAIGDISNTDHTLQQKKMGCIRYHSFVECFGLLDANALQRFQPALALCEAFSQWHPASVVLHAPYSVSNSLIGLVNSVSDGKITTIHNQESPGENELFRQGSGDFLRLFDAMVKGHDFFTPSGLSSLQTYLPKLSTQNNILLVHNTFSEDGDLAFAMKLQKELYWCLCPNANAYIEQRLPDIPLMIEHGCRMVLGTDSLASNHALNLLDEINTIARHYPGIALEQMLHWATAGGARALGMAASIGSFEKGKRPGIIQVANMTTATQLPQTPDIRVIAKST